MEVPREVADRVAEKLQAFYESLGAEEQQVLEEMLLGSGEADEVVGHGRQTAGPGAGPHVNLQLARKAGGEQQEYLVIKFQDLLISS